MNQNWQQVGSNLGPSALVSEALPMSYGELTEERGNPWAIFILGGTKWVKSPLLASLEQRKLYKCPVSWDTTKPGGLSGH